MPGSDILTDLQDDDILVIYRDTKGPGRRKSSRIAWGTVKRVVLSAQPTVKGDQGPPGKDGAPGPAGPQGDTGPVGARGATGAQGPAGPKGADGAQGAAGAKGDTGPQGSSGPQGAAGAVGPQGAQGPAGKDGATIPPIRVVGTTDANGIATVTWPKPFTVLPDVDVVEGWSGDQMITGAVVTGSLTTAGCKVQVMVSRATLLLSTGPFQKAGQGVSVTVRAIGLTA